MAEIEREMRHWQAAFDAIQDAIVLLDIDGKILKHNRAFREFTGKSDDEIIGRFCFQLIHHTDTFIEGCPLLRSQASLKRESLEIKLLDKWFQVTADPVFNESGDAMGFVHVMSDVTQSKRAEKKLRQSEHLLSESQRIANIGSWDVNIATGKITWSDEMYRIYHTTADAFEHTAEAFIKLIHPDDREAMRQWIEATAAGEKKDDLEFRIIAPDGTIRFIRGAGEPVFDDGGRVISMFGTAQDITERKKSEYALKEAESRLCSLMQTASDAIIIADSNGDIISWNSGAQKIFGYSESEVQGKALAILMPDRYINDHVNGMKRVIATGQSKYLGNTLEFHGIRKDGTEFPLELSVNAWVRNKEFYFMGIIRDITERKKLEKTVFESEKRLKTIIDTEPHCVKLINAHGTLIEMNPAGLAIIEADSIEQVRGASLYSLISPNYVDAFKAHVSEVLSGGSGSLEFELIGLKGTRRWLLTHSVPLRNSEGEIIALLGITQDISERKQAEELLSLELKLNAAMAKISEKLLGAESIESVCEVVRDNAQEITGSKYGYAGYIEQSTGFLVCPTLTRDIWYECKIAGKTVVFEKFGGLWGWVLNNKKSLMTNMPDKDPRSTGIPAGHIPIRRFLSVPAVIGGKLIGQISVANADRDYTECDLKMLEHLASIFALGIVRRITEDRLRESEDSFRKISQEFHGLLDAIPDNITLQDKDLKILWANKGAADGLGKKLEDVIGQYCYKLWHNRTSACELCPVIDSFKTGKPASFIVTTPDNRIWDLRTVPLIDEHGKVANVIEVGRDITEHRRLEDQLREAQKLESIGQLAGGIAHDFNNILTAVLGFGGMLQMEIDDADHLKHYVQEILAAGQRGASLTHQIIAFSRKQVLDMKPVNLNEIIRDLDKMLHRLVREDVEINLNLSGNGLVVLADASQIDQVIINLVTNARDAMPKGGRITIAAEPFVMDDSFIEMHGYGKAGKYVLITISDTGIGMDADMQSHIFEPFFTTKETGKGTGLGLAVVHGIVKQHNGYINVYSEMGKGTAFRIYLPLVEHAAIETVKGPAASVKRGTETILVAEDEQSLRNLAKIMLESAGYKVLTAKDGKEAVEIYKEHMKEIDIVVLDVIMPVMNGEEAFGEMRRLNPSLKALFMSGYTRDTISEHGIAEGQYSFVQKPVRLEPLLSKIREVLNGAE